MAETAATSCESRLALRVLVVDDDRDAADSLAILLGLWGHRPRVAYRPETALMAVADDPPDVVLIDPGLRRTDGFSLAAELRARSAMKGAKLFAVTGHSIPAVRGRAPGAAFDEFLLKPFEPDALRRMLADLQTGRQ
ncbi:MAG: response regulator [Zavarzinella sp.]|nr:response regulator [Zavarzinella sp.]